MLVAAIVLHKRVMRAVRGHVHSVNEANAVTAAAAAAPGVAKVENHLVVSP